MTMIKPFALWSLVVLAIVTPLFYAGYVHHRHNNFTCESHLTIVDDGAVVDTIMTFAFRNGSGTYDSSGEYRQAGQLPIAISNKIAFRYWYEEGNAILISSDTNELPKRDEPYRRHIPDFFQHRDRGISIEIIPVNTSGYLFRFGNSPAFYCSND